MSVYSKYAINFKTQNFFAWTFFIHFLREGPMGGRARSDLDVLACSESPTTENQSLRSSSSSSALSSRWPSRKSRLSMSSSPSSELKHRQVEKSIQNSKLYLKLDCHFLKKTAMVRGFTLAFDVPIGPMDWDSYALWLWINGILFYKDEKGEFNKKGGKCQIMRKMNKEMI